MKIETTLGNSTLVADLKKGIDISIPVGKDGEVSAYGLPPSEISTFRSGGFVGDVNEGGSCNVRDIKMSPHGNGTHTECVGHISKVYKTIYETLDNFLFTCTLLTVDTSDVITKRHLETLALQPKTEALLIRTLPNTDDKLKANYLGAQAAFIDPEAMSFIVSLGIQHLLVDLPSVDHETDPNLKSHHIFWKEDLESQPHKTITELVYVPNSVEDGPYILNLMIPSIHCDAVPSKPIIYPLR